LHESLSHYDFCRVHKALRVTPAVEAALADRVRDLEEFVEKFASTPWGRRIGPK